MDGRDHSRSPRGVHGAAGGDDEVMTLIVEREKARMAKEFAQADQLREQLETLGVTLYDKTSSWKANDGRMGRIPRFAEIEAGGAENIQEVVVPNGNEEAAQIKHLVLSREQARAAKDWAQSDRIRDELKASGVEVFDKEKMWKARSGLSGVIIGWRGDAGPTDMEITTLVVQREKAREKGDWATSDMIRDELRQYGVDINDKNKVWRTNEGRSGPVPSWQTIVTGDGVAAAAHGGCGAPMPVHMMAGDDIRQQVIHAALQAADTPANAARTLQLLRGLAAGNAMAAGPGPPPMAPPAAARGGKGHPVGGAVPSRGGAMMGAPPAASQIPDANEAMAFIGQCQAQGRPVADAEIDWLVAAREKVRQAKDFATADQIRNAMRSVGVELHEKEKRWATQDGRVGAIPMWGNLN